MNRNFQLAGTVNVPLRIFGAGQLLLEAVQTEAVMDTLAQNAAGGVLTLQHQQIVDAVLPGRDSRRQTCGAAADHQHIHPLHAVSLLRHVTSPPSARPEWCR